MTPWIFDGPESVQWLIEHPLPIFLCVVKKAEARILVYHTTPRFAAWALPHQHRLELILGTQTKAQTSEWVGGDTFKLAAPILSFTIRDILKTSFRDHVAKVLKFWVDYDVENLFRIKSGIPRFRVPYDYETNKMKVTGLIEQGGQFQEESLLRARDRLEELIRAIAENRYRNNDMINAAIYAMVLRQMSPDYIAGKFTPHDSSLHMELNSRFGMVPPTYLYQACDSLVKLVKDLQSTASPTRGWAGVFSR